jgi:hypothetical protein
MILDASFIRQQTDTLSANLARLPADDSVPPQTGNDLRQSIAMAVGPAVVSLTGRLSAGAPGEEDRLRVILATFLADPATADGLARYSRGDDVALDDLAQIFADAAADDVPVSRRDFEDALIEFKTVWHAATRRLEAQSGRHPWMAMLLEPPAAAEAAETGDVHEREAHDLIDALAAAGMGGIREGRVMAADGESVLFEWHGGWAMATPEERPRMEEEEPPAANGGSPAESLPDPPAPLLPPAPEPPGDGSPAIVALRLDAALPEKVVAGREFDLAVSIRQPASPVLAPADLTRHESADFAALWPDDTPFISFRVQVAATDCDIVGPESEQVRLLAGQDSPPVYFRLRPRQVGPVSVIISVYQEADWIGATRVVTDATNEELRGEMRIHVDSRSAGDPENNLATLRRILADGYNIDELRDLCFELGIDYEDIPGDTRSAKARELVLFARRRGLEARLVEQIMRDRPHLLVSA